jgi:hypothetical protein
MLQGLMGVKNALLTPFGRVLRFFFKHGVRFEIRKSFKFNEQINWHLPTQCISLRVELNLKGLNASLSIRIHCIILHCHMASMLSKTLLDFFVVLTNVVQFLLLKGTSNLNFNLSFNLK